MPRAVAIRKADLDRVLKALRDSGRDVGRVEITPTGITIVPRLTDAPPVDELSAWRAKRGSRALKGA